MPAGWTFLLKSNADAAQATATASLPKDTLADGSVAPVQYTQRWADVVTLSNGRFGFAAPTARTGMAKPALATLVADIATLLPLKTEA